MTAKWLGAALALALLALAGCAAPAGGRHLSCSQACNRDYDICADSAGANRGGASFFGVGAACQRQLTACLKNCDLAAVQSKPAAPATKNGAKPAPGETPKPPAAP